MVFKPGESGNPNGNPNWVKGVSGNPAGRVKNPMTTLVAESIARIEKKRQELKEKGELPDGELVSFVDNFVEMGYSNPQIMIAVMRKLAPDLKQLDVDMNALINGDLNLAHMSDEDINAELKKLRSRKNGDKPASGSSGKKSNRKGADPRKGNGSKKKPE